MPSSNMLFTALAADAASRLDVFLSKQLPDISRSRIQAWLVSQGEKISRHLKPGEEFTLQIPETKVSDLLAQDLPLEIIYEDADLVVVNKPAGLVVHPGAGNPDGTLVNALLHRFPGLCVGDQERPGIVHRL